MKIECNTAFLDGRDRFEAGDVRTVPDEAAARFIAAGWATPFGGDSPVAVEGETNLNIHSSVIGTGDSNG